MSDEVPAVYALGGCDVASPEFPENVSFALLRNNGVAVYAGTRSVWACKQHGWAKHTKYYPRLFFGMSTVKHSGPPAPTKPEAPPFGGTNFLINLLGDPSIVPMPETTGETLSVSPAFPIRLTAIQGDPSLPSVDYEVQNNGPTTQRYTIKTVPGLKADIKSCELKPGDFKRFKLSIDAPEKLSTGSHEFLMQIASPSEKKQVTLIADIIEKSQVYANNFDSPVGFIDKDRKPAKIPTEQSLTKGVSGSATNVTQFKAQLKTPHWGNRKSYTVSSSKKFNPLATTT
ncbi:hypothetical protein [Rubritalea tangerina]|uniref:hypothetical protein n=1 Tax=Rubritalea tangerina TaxID=430798 RepID=UPI003617252D